MERLLFKVQLDIEPVTWGVNDAQKREKIRKAIKEKIPKFDEQYIDRIVKAYKEISVILNCYLIDPMAKDIDNLAKIPIDAVFFSAQNERGSKNWESKITSLTVKKLKSSKNALEIILLGIAPS